MMVVSWLVVWIGNDDVVYIIISIDIILTEAVVVLDVALVLILL